MFILITNFGELVEVGSLRMEKLVGAIKQELLNNKMGYHVASRYIIKWGNQWRGTLLKHLKYSECLLTPVRRGLKKKKK